MGLFYLYIYIHIYIYTGQSRVFSGLRPENNTLRRHFYIMGLIVSPLCRKFRAEEETSDPLVTLRRALQGFLYLDPEDVQNSKSEGKLELH